MTDKIVVLVTTHDEDEAAKVARALVDEKLAACANIVRGVRSIYSWKGETCDDSECLMLIKTVAGNFERLERRVRELHGYTVPEVIALPVTDGSKPYLEWVEENS
ncbi:MAG TPA: divalent-cation tolerance protein CutA, partial [Nitrospirota bacterium]|nr:divalent-cation tolerance protein CutA [Nitrospirota bacterium]